MQPVKGTRPAMAPRTVVPIVVSAKPYQSISASHPPAVLLSSPCRLFLDSEVSNNFSCLSFPIAFSEKDLAIPGKLE
ncbi:DNA binding protein [Zea mays]|uniref:DNA binding protein n=1 Tax=Zea mays TaxID=4577 RepID=A0A1D6Q3A8_MAIZE|nr:DNA binding protein [Zea mays]